MDEAEARDLLQAQLQPWRKKPYKDLSTQIDASHRFEIHGRSGAWYQGWVRIFWDARPNGAVRVSASIDDGGWRALVPLTDSFILAPDGTFIGE